MKKYDGRTLKQYYCKKCKNKKIRFNTALYGSGLCISCGQSNKKVSEKTKRKISKALMGQIISNVSRKKMSKSHKGKKAFRYIDGRSLKQHYCKDCNNKITRQAKRCSSCCRKEKLNYGYIDGSRDDYPREFRRIKEQIRKRDCYKCQNCGMTEEEHISVYGRALEVHHIDYNKINCKEYNLITTCKQCNVRANFNRDYWYACFSYIMEEKSCCLKR